MAQGATKETAKELVAALALNDDLRAKFDAAGSAEEKFGVLSNAGYKIIMPDDIAEVQSDLQQKGMFSDLGGYLGKAVVNAGFDPLHVGAASAGTIGSAVGSLADLIA